MNSIRIKKINRESVTDQVFEELKDKIQSGVFSEGEKLPSENSLADLFGVSRISVRSAIQRLETIGLVDVKVGEGTFVNEMNFFNITNQLSELIAQDTMMPYLSEVRLNIESHCTVLAMERATEDDLNELEELADRLLSIARKNDYDSYTELDYLFHYTLCRASKNKLYELIYSSIRDLFHKTIRANVTKGADVFKKPLMKSAVDHISLVQMIKDKDYEALDCITSITTFILMLDDIYVPSQKYRYLDESVYDLIETDTNTKTKEAL